MQGLILHTHKGRDFPWPTLYSQETPKQTGAVFSPHKKCLLICLFWLNLAKVHRTHTYATNTFTHRSKQQWICTWKNNVTMLSPAFPNTPRTLDTIHQRLVLENHSPCHAFRQSCILLSEYRFGQWEAPCLFQIISPKTVSTLVSIQTPTFRHDTWCHTVEASISWRSKPHPLLGWQPNVFWRKCYMWWLCCSVSLLPNSQWIDYVRHRCS